MTTMPGSNCHSPHPVTNWVEGRNSSSRLRELGVTITGRTVTVVGEVWLNSYNRLQLRTRSRYRILYSCSSSNNKLNPTQITFCRRCQQRVQLGLVTQGILLRIIVWPKIFTREVQDMQVDPQHLQWRELVLRSKQLPQEDLMQQGQFNSLRNSHRFLGPLDHQVWRATTTIPQREAAKEVSDHYRVRQESLIRTWLLGVEIAPWIK